MDNTTPIRFFGTDADMKIYRDLTVYVESNDKLNRVPIWVIFACKQLIVASKVRKP